MKDCLGSVRDVVDLSDGTVLELDDYHAFGERVDDNTMQTTSINRWRYNAKEEQDSVARLQSTITYHYAYSFVTAPSTV